MIRLYSPRTFSVRRAVLLLTMAGGLLVSHAGHAQGQPARHNVLRVDVGGILVQNMRANFLSEHKQLLLPLWAGYERQLGPRTSGSVEVLVNGGEPEEKLTGLALQGRYYLIPGQHADLAGFYVAPTLSTRLVKQAFHYSRERVSRKLGGAGVLLGVQVPLTQQGRLLLDAAAGAMAWGRLGTDQVQNPAPYGDNRTYYEQHGMVLDGRLGVGYSF